MNESCPHKVVYHREDTVPLFGEETMPVDKWECYTCHWEFNPRRKHWYERLAEWREVRRFRKSIRKA